MVVVLTDKCQEALLHVLQNAPANSKNQAVKDRAANLAVRVLTSFKGDMDQCIKSLDNKCVDTLMKYIYRGFETPSENSSAILLTWHQKTFAAGAFVLIVKINLFCYYEMSIFLVYFGTLVSNYLPHYSYNYFL
ncbi:Actin- protein 2/3 complex subunit 5 [Bulinus truncatus]|nr:Actin- protein 2/3 complex subunit 5 [Bulinus truncatus]